MTQPSLEDLLQTVNPVELRRNSQEGAYVYPVVPTEFSNWKAEQVAWQKAAVLFDQSHHMANLYIKGPDALKLISYIGFNTFKNFPTNMAKQLVPVTYDGYVIGDGILFHLEEDVYEFVGRAPSVNWIQFHAETGDWNVERVPGDREAERRADRGHQVLPDRLHHHQGQEGPSAQARHVRPARTRGLRSVPGVLRDQGRDPGGRPGVRPHPGRLPRLRGQHPGVRLDPAAAARHLHRREAEGVPRVAPGRRLRGLRRDARRQLRIGEHRGLLPHPLRARLRPHGPVRPRLHRPRGPGGDGQAVAAPEGDARLEQGGRGQDRGLAVHRRDPGQGPGRADLELLLVQLRLGVARRQARRPVAVHRVQPQRAPRALARRHRPGHRGRDRGDAGLGRAERRLAQGLRRAAAQAGRGPRHRLASAVLGRGPRALRGGLAPDRQGLSVRPPVA